MGKKKDWPSYYNDDDWINSLDEAKRRYLKSEKGKDALRRYFQSDKGKAAFRKYYQKKKSVTELVKACTEWLAENPEGTVEEFLTRVNKDEE